MADLQTAVEKPKRRPDLASPVSALLRPTLKVESVDSIALAALRFRQNGAAVLPVTVDERLVGVITDLALANALGSGVDPTDAVEGWMSPAETIFNRETGAEALRRIVNGAALVVVDEDQRVLGLVSGCELWPRKRLRPRPAMVGGMATPFGVYLTNGTVSGGVSQWALAATGATMFLMLFTAGAITTFASQWLAGQHINSSFVDGLLRAATIGIFLLMMRLVPLSGIHGAEHQVVHAIEREEELKPEVIRRMPRIHPRCGTNLAAGASIFLTIFFGSWPAEGEIRFIVAALATVLLWRKVGGFLQQYITTKRPSDKQLQSGIRAGEMLLERFAEAKVTSPTIGQRIWSSGVLHVMTGAVLMTCLVWLFELLVPLSFLPKVN